MKRVFSCLLLFCFLFSGITVYAQKGKNIIAENNAGYLKELESNAESLYLVECKTGEVLYKYNETKEASLASVTKIMTLLLVMEAIEEGKISLDETVTVSEYASSMGGSQVYLKEGELMSVDELIKCTVIASANDAAVALAERVSGSESIFVSEMNKRAKDLGMQNSNFENVTGLDDTTENHYSSAMDIAIMSQELIKHERILKYSSLWQDTIRDGAFTLTNTNRLVRFYEGCNGLKTGSTDKAGFCISASAKRGDMQLVAVVMGAKTRDVRNSTAKALLDYGFANYSIFKSGENIFYKDLSVRFGAKDSIDIYSSEFYALIPKGNDKYVNVKYEYPEYLTSPIKEGDVIGKTKYYLNDTLLGEGELFVKESIEKIGFFDILFKIFSSIIS